MATSDILNRLTSVSPSGATDAVGEPAVRDPLAAANDSRRPIRIGLWALVLGLGGFMLWAGFAPLDEGVPAQGQVAIDTKRKTVQHLQGGIIQEVLVHEGQMVNEGQLLIKLDDATTRANYETVRQQYLMYRAVQGRLQAEQLDAPGITFAQDLKDAAKTDPQIAKQLATQTQLFNTRRTQLKADLQAFNESIAGQQAIIQANQQMLGSRKDQIRLLNEQLANTRDLVKEGYAPRNQQLDLERMIADTQAQQSQIIGNVMSAQSAISELRQKAISRQQDYRKDVETQLSDASREVESDEQKYKALSNDLQRTEIKAPATGQVVGLAVQTVGGVVQPGQKLMDIVPENEALLLEVKVPPNLIDRVHAGMPVDVRFNAFAHSPMLVVDGKVASVSGDLLSEPANPNIQYYLARVSLTADAYKKLGQDRQLQPGMPVEVVLKTGERTLLTYLLHPLTKRIAASMKEQ
ncbi:MAG TPA: HlyD family type I secretion periplasmic adaptor subunit [Ramlibacter sp.]|uniref:HlyD family type I secretion periplasmic adaptor subunit n=1 Tax=Ramlibacter sp. TaxID=1917967 RepID=UPI002C71E2CB|nr:HlyD family type I secretion periplasmic adaptor subunit [Ramlibacter sp.]HVZ46143.1 HlyD family type I secretion periplasmic adaptor subunit [Ramlibacter sp.]